MVIEEFYKVFSGRILVIGVGNEKVYYLGEIDYLPEYLMSETIVQIMPINGIHYIYIDR